MFRALRSMASTECFALCRARPALRGAGPAPPPQRRAKTFTNLGKLKSVGRRDERFRAFKCRCCGITLWFSTALMEKSNFIGVGKASVKTLPPSGRGWHAKRDGRNQRDVKFVLTTSPLQALTPSLPLIPRSPSVTAGRDSSLPEGASGLLRAGVNCLGFVVFGSASP